MEKVAIAELTLERKTEDFLDRQARAYTYADYILEYPSQLCFQPTTCPMQA